jgi:hypothetical protein
MSSAETNISIHILIVSRPDRDLVIPTCLKLQGEDSRSSHAIMVESIVNDRFNGGQVIMNLVAFREPPAAPILS